MAMFFFQKRLNGYPLTGIAKDGFVPIAALRIYLPNIDRQCRSQLRTVSVYLFFLVVSKGIWC